MPDFRFPGNCAMTLREYIAGAPLAYPIIPGLLPIPAAQVPSRHCRHR
jgi:hypothetical protein